ncbi:MAG: hypothetical protein IJ252_00295 [Solobacterium sp.]|nr:hypothetical protein [Solobacterium sp.]
MVKKPEYLKPVTDKKVIARLEKALSDTSKRDEALRRYKLEQAEKKASMKN